MNADERKYLRLFLFFRGSLSVTPAPATADAGEPG